MEDFYKLGMNVARSNDADIGNSSLNSSLEIFPTMESLYI